MNKKKSDRWHGLPAEALAALVERDYGVRSLGQRIAEVGVEAGQLAAANRADPEIAPGLDSGRGDFRAHDLSAAASGVVRRIRPTR